MKLTILKLRRMQHDFLQIELAQRTNIPRCRLSEIENGHVQARPDELLRLAAALNISADVLQHDGDMVIGNQEQAFAQSVASQETKQGT